MIRPSITKNIARYLMLLLWFVLFASILVIAKNMDDRQKKILEVERVSLIEKGDEIFTPYELMSSKGNYQNRMVTIRAQVYTEPIVCDKKQCPDDDKCCGCSRERDLLAQDFRLNSQNEGLTDSLRLKQGGGRAICQRKEKSCDYNCSDWQIGSVYDIDGVFNYTSGPSGWNRPTGIYLDVANKNLLRVIGFQDNIGRLIERFSFAINSVTSDGTYILP